MSKEDGSGGETGSRDTRGPDTSDVPAKDTDVYDNRGPRKIIRVVTVMAYLVSVSFVGIFLSAYYVFLWEPPNPRHVGHLRAEPRVQYLMAASPSPETSDLTRTKTTDSPMESEPNSASDSSVVRVTQDLRYDGNSDVVGSAQPQPHGRIFGKRRGTATATLLKLGQSLGPVSRLRNQDSIRFVKAETVVNSTEKTDHAIRCSISGGGESCGNVAREKDRRDNLDLPTKFTNSTNEYGIENASESVTIPGIKTNQNYFGGESVIDTELDAQRLSKPNIFRRKSARPADETDDRRSIAAVSDKDKDDPSDDPSNVRPAIATANLSRSEGYVGNWTGEENRPAAAVRPEIDNRTRRIARGRVSLKSPADSDSIDDPQFHHRPSNYPIAVEPSLHPSRNTEGVYLARLGNMQLPRKMSAHNVMASIGRTLGTRDVKPPAPNEVRFAGDERKDKLYEPKHRQKLVRVLTVMAYVIFVSMAAILLSLYYTFVWNPTDQAARKMRANKTECANLLHDPETNRPISNERQIEKVTARSTTMDNGRLGEADSSATRRHLALWQTEPMEPTEPTETADINVLKEMSVQLASISATTGNYPNYRNDLTGTANNDDESVT